FDHAAGEYRVARGVARRSLGISRRADAHGRRARLITAAEAGRGTAPAPVHPHRAREGLRVQRLVRDNPDRADAAADIQVDVDLGMVVGVVEKPRALAMQAVGADFADAPFGFSVNAYARGHAHGGLTDAASDPHVVGPFGIAAQVHIEFPHAHVDFD